MTQDSAFLRVFTQQDADSHALDDERVAVLGYGNLGRAVALNLRDSGVAPLVVGNIEDEYAEQARAEGFAVQPIRKAVAASDIALVLLPDEVIPEVFAAEIAPGLGPGSAVIFASGYTLAYGLIDPPADVDVLLLAPRMGGEHIRQRFLSGRGFFAYISVERESNERAWRRLLGIADAVGALRAGVLELDARREADLDLFVEQTLGAAVGVAIMSAFTLGVEAGIPPEAMVMEMYMSGEMETVFQAFRERGFFRASDFHGPTALYGGFMRTMQLMMSDLSGKFREALEEIQSGEFARQFQAEREAGYPTLSQAQAMTAEESPVTRPIVQAEKHLRAMLGES
ncbi:MAG: NAD(P)-binding domain-containing protein [Anaerolineae bacterium]